AFKRGDLFEVVPSQTFVAGSPRPPSEIFRRLREWNPSPYGFLINLGDAEYLVGASPEMYVRVDGDRVETCPISGTIARGRVLLVDHQDSFVHTLANYLRQTGAEVMTLRAGFPAATLDDLHPDLAVLSPGPGTPGDFDVSGTLGALVARGIPTFGVCLGLQGMVEHFGGALGVLDYPMHGKASRIRVLGGRIFEGLPKEFTAGRYHSLL